MKVTTLFLDIAYTNYVSGIVAEKALKVFFQS